MPMKKHEAGFTLIELLMAMAVFSFMLLIIVVGFINVVKLHNQALASNMTQDNARKAMNELVRSVRDSTAVQTPAAGANANELCLAKQGGQFQGYYVPTSGPQTGVLMRSDNCVNPRINPQAITNSVVSVVNFRATNGSTGSTILKPEVALTITVASNNGTTNVAGANTTCKPNNADRAFCSTITLTSGAVPR